MKAVAIYVGKKGVENYEHGLRAGVWGFKPDRTPEQPLAPGDWIVFGRGGDPRRPEEEWLEHPLAELAFARLTSGLVQESAPEWPDEVRAGTTIYPKRLRFETATRIQGPVNLTNGIIPIEVALAIRNAGITNSGSVVPISKAPGSGSANSNKQKPVETAVAKATSPIALSAAQALIEIENFIRSRGFNFGTKTLRAFFAALRAKPFVILAGNSGTGKSRLARLFAEAVGANVGNGRFQMVPVRPDWNDSSDLLGYFDLNGDFRPGHLVATLLRARAQRDKPFFLCLDEMNLARVEHYFSDFLSIIESRRRENGAVVTDPVLGEEHIRRMKRESLPGDVAKILEDMQRGSISIGFPPNLFVVGTVNMDETTQPFSRKVLDRANTLEFNEIDLEEGLNEDRPETPIPALDLSSAFLASELTSLNDLPTEHRDTAEKIASFLQSLNGSLALAGFEVGYRVRDEAIAFTVYALEAGMSREEAEENIVLQKVLPRVQGSSPRIETALISLMKRLAGDEEVPDKEATDFTMRLEQLRVRPDASPVLRKLAGMLLIFREEGFTSFWLA
jgi:energy-coupling factor transporter ATP-binding protein EcfA2